MKKFGKFILKLTAMAAVLAIYILIGQYISRSGVFESIERQHPPTTTAAAPRDTPSKPTIPPELIRVRRILAHLASKDIGRFMTTTTYQQLDRVGDAIKGFAQSKARSQPPLAQVVKERSGNWPLAVFFLGELGEDRDGAAIEAVLSVFNEEDSPYRSHAAFALAQMGHTAVGPPALDLLEKTDAQQNPVAFYNLANTVELAQPAGVAAVAKRILLPPFPPGELAAPLARAWAAADPGGAFSSLAIFLYNRVWDEEGHQVAVRVLAQQPAAMAKIALLAFFEDVLKQSNQGVSMDLPDNATYAGFPYNPNQVNGWHHAFAAMLGELASYVDDPGVADILLIYGHMTNLNEHEEDKQKVDAAIKQIPSSHIVKLANYHKESVEIAKYNSARMAAARFWLAELLDPDYKDEAIAAMQKDFSFILKGQGPRHERDAAHARLANMLLMLKPFAVAGDKKVINLTRQLADYRHDDVAFYNERQAGRQILGQIGDTYMFPKLVKRADFREISGWNRFIDAPITKPTVGLSDKFLATDFDSSYYVGLGSRVSPVVFRSLALEHRADVIEHIQRMIALGIEQEGFSRSKKTVELLPWINGLNEWKTSDVTRYFVELARTLEVKGSSLTRHVKRIVAMRDPEQSIRWHYDHMPTVSTPSSIYKETTSHELLAQLTGKDYGPFKADWPSLNSVLVEYRQ